MFVLIVLGSVLLVFAVLGGGLALFWKASARQFCGGPESPI